ncbi:MAG: EF-P lysine aminoacylase EpmA [Gammaproteobacteria bacterium]
MQTQPDWRPTASLDALKLRATLLSRVRAWFEREGVLEVDTPALSCAATTSPHLASFACRYYGPGVRQGTRLYLHTSPEFPMKRLLAAGSESIYQICKVFRDGEYGPHHNPEFTLLEWYRTRYDHLDLMNEVEGLLTEILDGIFRIKAVYHWRYRDLFLEFVQVDPFNTTPEALQAVLESRHIVAPVGMQEADLDSWLDLVMTHLIEPRLGAGLVFVRDYPVTQAALAQLRPGNPPVASRFEVYLNGIELANGFHELTNVHEQRMRFDYENRMREHYGLPAMPVDERLQAALAAGLPDCAGVALGFDRLLMIVSGAECLADVMSFDFEST